MMVARPALCVLGLLLLSQLSSTWAATVKGKVFVPGAGVPADSVVHLITSEGQLIKAFCDNDGSFTLTGVPKGSHVLQPHLIGYFYPEIRVDTASKGGVVRAFYLPPNSKQLMSLQEPLMIRPIGEMQYYEKRKPLDLWAILKSPYGLMIVFSVFIIFVFPMMKVDPEEFKQFKEQISGGTETKQPARIQNR